LSTFTQKCIVWWAGVKTMTQHFFLKMVILKETWCNRHLGVFLGANLIKIDKK
jgi:hypothetical protein